MIKGHLPGRLNVLDFGCGAGRRLKVVREESSRINCVEVEIDPFLNEYCSTAISSPSSFHYDLSAVRERCFDMILVMANGISFLGMKHQLFTI